MQKNETNFCGGIKTIESPRKKKSRRNKNDEPGRNSSLCRNQPMDLIPFSVYIYSNSTNVKTILTKFVDKMVAL